MNKRIISAILAIAALCVLLLIFALTEEKNNSANDKKELQVLATIKPLHSLVQTVMGKSGKAKLLIEGNVSPHQFALKPSHMQMLQSSDIIFYIDENFEHFLRRTLPTLPQHIAKIGIVKEVNNIKLLPIRKGGVWEKLHDHVHDDKTNCVNSSCFDMHIWLDLENAQKIVTTIAQKLTMLYPANRPIYEENARLTIKRLKELDKTIRANLAELANRPFIVFHDAYQYFEERYHLNSVGAITLEPNEAASAQRIRDIQNKIITSSAVCIFKEPQFSSRIIDTIATDSNIKTGIIDPIGSDLEDGEEMYFTLLNTTADSFVSCLK